MHAHPLWVLEMLCVMQHLTKNGNHVMSDMRGLSLLYQESAGASS